MDIDSEGERLVRAFSKCIEERGINNVRVDDVARCLGTSRSGLYRLFGSWPQVVMFGYEAMLEWVDQQIPSRGEDRRVELETWWSALVLLLASPLGRRLLAMRSLAELHTGAHALEDFEMTHLRSFRQWCDASPPAVRSCWALVRVASNPTLTVEQRLELREIAWLMLGGSGMSAEVLEADALHGLM